MSDIKLGNLVADNQNRDAIHIAITPVISEETLEPGQHVGLIYGSEIKVSGLITPPIGIVDPFLKNLVKPGQRFWLLLYPQTITSLRHEWTHPAFQSQHKSDAETFLSNVSERIGCSSEALKARLDIYASGSASDDDEIQQGLNSLNEELLLASMWAAYETVRGVKVRDDIKKSTYFSCAC